MKQIQKDIAEIIRTTTNPKIVDIDEMALKREMALKFLDIFEKEKKIYCPKCKYEPTRLVYIEKCIFCNTKLKFPKGDCNKNQFLKNCGVEE